ncbi:hypothetical protein SARC_10235 [Sphaeroforma arctica JP610]|uniref:Uncharacterized protein n=1 Tax=Sphaeroforma arctica JP610 TaxID=667725 RepID=A0A0L0FLD4_9EUKA|nr:hypothetical protein SARC_10235 [Sphaeroforma arctica JP610]KNC77301.1 hypothetical protein SARC_10235 [Sphaeroforma arctica JP610]|eukprot:XP_014151203.1 hypothetical protein SARC_10235 [Sphaeroforma arctica JP610]
MLSQLFLLATAAAVVSAVDVPVTAGANSLSAAIDQAADGDVLVLAAGTYQEAAAIQISKAVTIRSADPNNMAVIQASTPVLFSINNLAEFALEDILIEDSAGTQCGLEEPIALTAEFEYVLFPPVTYNTAGTMKMGITEGALNVVGSIGNLFNTRVLKDIMFDDCDYEGGKLIAPFVDILSNCRADLGFSVLMSNFAVCGVVETDYPTMSTYESDLKIWSDEFVTMIDDDSALRVPVNRTGTAMTHLKIEIDRVANVAATIEPKWPYADLEAAITSVDIMSISENQSTIVLQVNVPSPYTVMSGATGEVLFNQTDDGELSTGAWRVTEACSDIDAGELCVQSITFDITACDLSGLYYIFGLQFGCIENDSNGQSLECPQILGDADLYFAIDSNDLCDDMFQLEALFTPTITLRPDTAPADGYVGNRPNDIFSLGDMSYWTIHLWTNESGVGFDYAEIIKIVRTSPNVDCTGYKWFGDDIDVTSANLDQTFVGYGPLQFPAADINFPMLVTVDMACASSDREGSSLEFNFTVLGDYMDNSGRRRRREVGGQNFLDLTQNDLDRRESGEANVEAPAGVIYNAKDFPKLSNTGTGAGASSSNEEEEGSGALLAALLSMLLLCCCCCCCAVVGVVMYRRKQKNKKEEQSFAHVNSHSVMSVGGTQSTTSMGPARDGNQSTMSVGM